MCSPGMLQSGLSYFLLEKWCESPKNGIIFTGYCAEGSLGKQVMNAPQILNLNNVDKQFNMSVG